MKTILAAAAVLAFSAPAAFAACAGHVSASVEKPMTVASAEPTIVSAPIVEPATDGVTTGAITDKSE